MVYIAAKDDNITFFRYDWIFVDEVQDLNKAQRKIALDKIMKPSSRFICVGDVRQCIYGFSGADVESFKSIQKMPNTTTLPLSICYRCDKEIVRFAQKIVPELEYFEGKGEGIVRKDGENKDIREGDYVLCRNETNP